MRYSEDLRRRVIKFVRDGGSKSEASRRFDVNRDTVYEWLLEKPVGKPGPRAATKVDMAKLEQHVAAHNDAYLSERAAAFGVTPQAIWYALKRLDMRKKNVAVHGKM